MNKNENKKITGLTDEQVRESRKKYGTNKLTQIPLEPLWKKILVGFLDPILLILFVALAIQVGLFFIGRAEWYEPFFIVIAILVSNGISSLSDNYQQKKALALKEEAESKERTKVVRNGEKEEIPVRDVVKDDIIFLQAGDKIPADGILISGQLRVDQSSINGETEEAKKLPLEEKNILLFTVPDPGEDHDKDEKILKTYQNGVFTETRLPSSEYSAEEYEKQGFEVCDTALTTNKQYLYRGTVVCSGEAYMLAHVIGDDTVYGQMALEMQEETRDTPLQVKLAKLAKQIAVFGYIGAASIILGILGKIFVSGNLPEDASEWVRVITDAVAVASTIIVCAVPEGLPSLTSMLLAFQSIKMAKDNVLVKKIKGLESAGSISILFTDKTGTLTEGKLSVAEVALGNVKTFSKFSEIHSAGLVSDIVTGIGINNSSDFSKGSVIGGNSTDRALMNFLVNEQKAEKIDKKDILSFDAFDSKKKMSSVVMIRDGKSVTYVKGAPEKIIENCTAYLDENGNEKPLTEKNYLNQYINAQAGRSMRLLAVARKHADTEEYTLICVLSIRDNVRKEVVSAIQTAVHAGIQVVMVTGDRKETASAIAKEAGLITKSTDLSLTSSELSEMTDEEIKKILPNLRVVSRALPSDKSRLVKIAQEMDHVVGMTGDGVNDSPALKKADVGFAMGSGTEVAKEAGDITILDDCFNSIVKAVLYGRTIFKSIRKFLIFQLTVNVAAVLTCFMGTLFGVNSVFTVIQLLTVNLAMDVLAAIAFGCEPALREYMLDHPIPRNENIVTKSMMGEILIGAFYITGVCLSILFLPAVRNLLGEVDMTYVKSAVYATFMMSIAFNGFNARTEHINVLKNIEKNKNFLIVMAVIFALQFIFVTFGGKMLSVERLSPETWGICMAAAFLIIPIDMVRKAVVFTARKLRSA